MQIGAPAPVATLTPQPTSSVGPAAASANDSGNNATGVQTATAVQKDAAPAALPTGGDSSPQDGVDILV